MLRAPGPPSRGEPKALGSGVTVEQFRRDDVEGRFVCGGQDHRRGMPRPGGLEPAEGAEAPAIPYDETREAPLRLRRDEIIADRHREGEEVGGHHGADGVGPRIGANRSAAAVAEKSGQGGMGTGHERLAEDIAIRAAVGGGRRTVEGDHRWRGQRGHGLG